jgi:DNA polymerase III subunit delta
MQKTKLPVFLFFGDEDYLLDQRIKELKTRLADPALNYLELDGAKAAFAEINSALQTPSLLGGERLVVIADLKVATDDQEQYQSLLQGLAPDVTVVLKNPKIDPRTKLFKLIAAAGEVCEFKSFAPWEEERLAAWVETAVRQEGKKIGRAAARLLIEISGSELRALTSEISKLVTYIGESAEIGEEAVLAGAAAGQKTAFDLLDALRQKELPRVLRIFQLLLRNKEELFPLLGLLASQYRLMLQLKAAGGNAAAVKASPYFARKCSEQLHRFSPAELQKALERLLAASLKLKSGEDQGVTFELLLAGLCGR